VCLCVYILTCSDDLDMKHMTRFPKKQKKKDYGAVYTCLSRSPPLVGRWLMRRCEAFCEDYYYKGVQRFQEKYNNPNIFTC
jgi:hypothetical protein